VIVKQAELDAAAAAAAAAAAEDLKAAAIDDPTEVAERQEGAEFVAPVAPVATAAAERLAVPWLQTQNQHKVCNFI